MAARTGGVARRRLVSALVLVAEVQTALGRTTAQRARGAQSGVEKAPAAWKRSRWRGGSYAWQRGRRCGIGAVVDLAREAVRVDDAVGVH